jgi:hypothetical protein
MSVPHQHCILCGIHLTQGSKKRLLGAQEAQCFIQERCKPTPFLYRSLTAQATTPLRHVCIPCVNWKRRAETGLLKRTNKPMLQMDQLILFLMQPGRLQEPDHRCMDRLVKAIRQPDNPYRPVFPLPVLRISLNIQENTYQHCVIAWWDYNGRTEFFASAQEARRVRCAVKAGLVEDI